MATITLPLLNYSSATEGFTDNITSSDDFVINRWGTASTENDTVVASFTFERLETPCYITAVEPQIGYVKVGNNNLLSTEKIKIHFEWAYYSSTSNQYISHGLTGETTVSESSGETSVSYQISATNSTGIMYEPSMNPVVKMTITSTEPSIGCKLAMSDYTLKVTYEPILCTTSIRAVNAVPADTICLLDSSNNNLGSSRAFEYNTEYKFYAESCDGRKITRIDIFQDGSLVTSLATADEVISSGWVNDSGNILDVYSTALGNFECVVYFEEYINRYVIYVGQTQALRAYVGATEILNIL